MGHSSRSPLCPGLPRKVLVLAVVQLPAQNPLSLGKWGWTVECCGQTASVGKTASEGVRATQKEALPHSRAEGKGDGAAVGGTLLGTAVAAG